MCHQNMDRQSNQQVWVSCFLQPKQNRAPTWYLYWNPLKLLVKESLSIQWVRNREKSRFQTHQLQVGPKNTSHIKQLLVSLPRFLEVWCFHDVSFAKKNTVLQLDCSWYVYLAKLFGQSGEMTSPWSLQGRNGFRPRSCCGFCRGILFQDMKKWWKTRGYFFLKWWRKRMPWTWTTLLNQWGWRVGNLPGGLSFLVHYQLV